MHPITTAFVRDLEAHSVALQQGYVQWLQSLGTHPDAVSVPLGGGIASFAGRYDYLSQAVGLGFEPYDYPQLADELARFYLPHRVSANVEVANYTDVKFAEALTKAGFVPQEYTNCWVMAAEQAQHILHEISPIIPERHLEAYAATQVGGFGAGAGPAAEAFYAFACRWSGQPACTRFGIWEDGQLLATGNLLIAGDTATFAGDATLSAHRGKGFQKHLIAARASHARQLGIKWLTAQTLPGSPSQHNYTRAGFQLAYARTNYRRG